MKLLELGICILSFIALSCGKSVKGNESPPSPFSIKVEGPLEVVSDSIAADLSSYKYCVKIDQVTREVYIATSHHHTIYWPEASAYIKRVRPDSLVVSSGIIDYLSLEEIRLEKNKTYKFYFFRPIRLERYDSIYFYFSYSLDSTFMETQTIEARLKYKTLDL
ncbi:MAG: hypothetical protein KIPDCIKN_01976 [Haliscomenobacter sp.]|nr:hypothetical protein [Haliscomenobacter sp.]